MIGGCSSKSAIFQLKMLKYHCGVYQMKDIIFLYLLKYLNLMINVKVENGIWKRNYFYYYFFLLSISQLIMYSMPLYGLKF